LYIQIPSSPAPYVELTFPNTNTTIDSISKTLLDPYHISSQTTTPRINKMDLSQMPQLRPAEIKTYHSKTYDRLSPSKTKFEAKGKTLLITAGGTVSSTSKC
jgi:hypothetical protein